MVATGASLRRLADKLRSPKYRSAVIAKHAKAEIARIHRQNEAALDTKLAQPRITVDGRRGAPLTSVKPNGVIVAEWNTEVQALKWVLTELRRVAPVRSGRYRDTFVLLVDGRPHSGEGPIPPAGEYIIYSPQPYARRLEGNDDYGIKGSSKQAPDGVFQVVAALAYRRFGDEGRVFYGYHAAGSATLPPGTPKGKRRRVRPAKTDNRVPAIFILTGTR